MSHGRPAKWTGRIARVRGVIARARPLAGRCSSCAGSTSASTGVAPAWMIALTVAQKVSGVVITSSPGCEPAASMLRCRAAVQELTATAWCAPRYRGEIRSNCATLGPVPSQPARRLATTSSISSSSIGGAPKTRNRSFGRTGATGPRARPVAVMRPPASRTARQAKRDSSRP